MISVGVLQRLQRGHLIWLVELRRPLYCLSSMKGYVLWHHVSSRFLLIYLSQGGTDDLCFPTVRRPRVWKGPLARWARDAHPVTVIHLISRHNKLKTLTHETRPFNKLALFSGGKWRIPGARQSIKVNDPAFHKSVTVEHRCINRRTHRLVKLRSSLRAHSISRPPRGVGPPRSESSLWP